MNDIILTMSNSIILKMNEFLNDIHILFCIVQFLLDSPVVV